MTAIIKVHVDSKLPCITLLVVVYEDKGMRFRVFLPNILAQKKLEKV